MSEIDVMALPVIGMGPNILNHKIRLVEVIACSFANTKIIILSIVV